MTRQREASAFVQLDAATFLVMEGSLRPAVPAAAGSPVLLAPHFSLDPRDGWWWAGPQAPARLARDDWRERFSRGPDAVAALGWGPPEEARFRAAFDSLQERFAAGDLRKGVPITRSRAALAGADARRLFERLLARVADLPEGVIAYGLFLPGGRGGRRPEFIVGATPELLVEVEDGGRVRTMAVAGTRRDGADAAAGLEGSAKDRAEHEAVVEDLLAQLGRWGTAVPRPAAVRRFGTLHHLVTDIDLAPEAPPDFEALVRTLHPTPALGVSPRGGAGAAWLRGIDEAGERRRFGAPFGVRWPSGAGRAIVAIRNVQYHDGHLEIWAGCGVVPASRYGEEWQEAQDKIAAVRTLWNL